MNNKELQDLLKQYPDDMPVSIAHPEGDWYMEIASVDSDTDREDPRFNHLIIITDFSNE